MKEQGIINPLIEETMNKTLVSARKVNGVVKSWRIDFHHPHIKNERIRPKGTYATKKEALLIAEKMYYEILVKHRNPNAFSNYKLNDAIDMYCENRGELGKDVGYINWIRERIGKKDIQHINQMDYQRLIRECKDKGNKNRTINRKLEILRAILNFTRDDLDWIQSYPKITKLKEEQYTAYPYSIEEIEAIRAHKSIKDKIPNALLILAPRKPERFQVVSKILDQSGLSYCKWSESKEKRIDSDVLLVDTLGDLLFFYSVSDVSFVGGSLFDIGGHNLIEPAILMKPILTGPKLNNVQEIADQFRSNQAIIIVSNHKDLSNSIIDLSDDKERCNEMTSNAKQVIEKNKGSKEKILQLIQPHIELH